MTLAEKFERPIFCFIDTPGAYPGIDAEERGQAEAIAYNLREMTKLTVPVIVTVIGEGGSGGALAIGVGDQILMLENSIYSVISPEGCAAILWKDSSQAARAAEELRLTAEDLLSHGIVDQVVNEPEGGALASSLRAPPPMNCMSVAWTSRVCRGFPSRSVHSSTRSRPSIYTGRPRDKYCEAVSACRPHNVTRNQVVTSLFSPVVRS